ncbi:hypothetical protein F4778DRAFT_730585 [Xylariomycetidae sp. FL2044]|nr:hypothetical protein F4778DRAFT_730585 [Xylariomycetidae sp. FL2044]
MKEEEDRGCPFCFFLSFLLFEILLLLLAQWPYPGLSCQEPSSSIPAAHLVIHAYPFVHAASADVFYYTPSVIGYSLVIAERIGRHTPGGRLQYIIYLDIYPYRELY